MATALFVLVGPKPHVRGTMSDMLRHRPAGEPWAIVCDEVGLLDYDAVPPPREGAQTSEVQWRELFGGCSCCVAAGSPVLRTTVAHLMRAKPRPRRFLIALSQDAQASRILPALRTYFGRSAPLHGIVMCTDVRTHCYLYAKCDEGRDAGEGAFEPDGGGDVIGRIVAPPAYREQFELADIVLMDELKERSIDAAATRATSPANDEEGAEGAESVVALPFFGVPKHCVAPCWWSDDLARRLAFETGSLAAPPAPPSATPPSSAGRAAAAASGVLSLVAPAPQAALLTITDSAPSPEALALPPPPPPLPLATAEAEASTEAATAAAIATAAGEWFPCTGGLASAAIGAAAKWSSARLPAYGGTHGDCLWTTAWTLPPTRTSSATATTNNGDGSRGGGGADGAAAIATAGVAEANISFAPSDMANLASRIATTAACGAAAEARARQEGSGSSDGIAPFVVVGASAMLVLRSTHGGYQLVAAEAAPSLEGAGIASEEGGVDDDDDDDDDGPFFDCDGNSGSGSSGGSDSGMSVPPAFVAATTTEPRPYFRRPGSSTWVEVTLTMRREQPRLPSGQDVVSTARPCAALERRFPPSALCRWEEEVEKLLAAALGRTQALLRQSSGQLP